MMVGEGRRGLWGLAGNKPPKRLSTAHPLTPLCVRWIGPLVSVLWYGIKITYNYLTATGMCKICSGRTDLKYKFFHRQTVHYGQNKTMQPRCNTAVLQQGWIVLYRRIGYAEKGAFVCALWKYLMFIYKGEPFNYQNGKGHTSWNESPIRYLFLIAHSLWSKIPHRSDASQHDANSSDYWLSATASKIQKVG